MYPYVPPNLLKKDFDYFEAFKSAGAVLLNPTADQTILGSFNFELGKGDASQGPLFGVYGTGHAVPGGLISQSYYEKDAISDPYTALIHVVGEPVDQYAFIYKFFNLTGRISFGSRNALGVNSVEIQIDPTARQLQLLDTGTTYEFATFDAALGNEFGALLTRAGFLNLRSGQPPTAGAGEVAYGSKTQTTVGAAGAATALPAQPSGYLEINVAGTRRVIPFYAQA